MENEEMLNKMVNRFLCWKLPKDFSPDAGISFRPTKPDGYDEPGCWPIGTNLFTAEQARAMIEHMMAEPTQAREHVSSADCWCEPEANYVDPETGATVYVHREIQ